MARVKCVACKSAQSLKEKRERQAASEDNVVDVLARGWSASLSASCGQMSLIAVLGGGSGGYHSNEWHKSEN